MGSSVNGASGGAMNCLRQFGRLYMLPRDKKDSARDLAVIAAAAAAPSIRATPVQEAAVAGRPTLHRGTGLKAAAVGLGSTSATWEAASSSRGVVAKEAAGPARLTASSSRGVVTKEAAGPPRQTESPGRGMVVRVAAGPPRKPTSSALASWTRGGVVEVTTVAPPEETSSAAPASGTRGAVVNGAAPSPRTSSPGTASSARGASLQEASCGTASAEASVTATTSAAISAAMAPNAASMKEQSQDRKLSSVQKKVELLQEIHSYLPPAPLKILDQSVFRQIAEAIQDKRGTEIDFTDLTGEECLRQVLPLNTKVGRGKLGLYRAARDLFKDEL